jgi:hypothetical protein
MRKVSLTILVSLFVLAFQGYAQNITGSISGRVVDAQGAAVPNATVTATEPARQVNETTKTLIRAISAWQVFCPATTPSPWKRPASKN